MADDYLEKFRLTAEHKKQMKEAFNALMDKQFEALEGTYLEMFKGLPRDVAENMSPQDAAHYVDMVVKEAADSITKGVTVIKRKVDEVARDDAKMAEIRKSFLDSLGYKEVSDVESGK